MSDISRFSFPTTILFGNAAVDEIPDCLRETGSEKPLIITDKALTGTAGYRRLTAALDNAGISCSVFSEVHPNPLDTDVEAAAAVYRAENCDGLIGLGGGSPLDTAKALAVLVSNGGTLSDYDVQNGGGGNIVKALPPIIGVPTTAGTGSEVGKCAVITSTAQHRKYMICHPSMLPVRAVLDPELTVSLPPHLTAATGMDALTHCIESLTAPIFHPMCDAIALKGIEFVAGNLETAVKEPENLEARGKMLLAASMGAVAFQKDLGAAHSLSHALSAVYGFQHGLGNAICLPVVMEYNRDAAKEQYALIPAYFGINTFGKDPGEAADIAIAEVRNLNARIGIPPSLKAAGIAADRFDEVVSKAYADPCHQTNARPCSEGDLRNLLRRAWEGE